MVNIPIISKKKQKSKNTTTSPIRKPTHIYLHDKCLQTIQIAVSCENLTVLYLHNNEICEIKNLNAATNLIHLYLQKNKIKKIENLNSLKKLTKLYLSHNEIAVVEGLENLNKLEELHIEKQRLPIGESLCFDPRSIESISNTLQVLNLSYNGINSIACLKSLYFLKIIDASHNRLSDIVQVCGTINNWYYLHEATFVGNPIAKQHRYRENLIANTIRLLVLDDKEISDTTRCFIKRFKQKQIYHRESKQGINVPGFVKKYPMAVQKAVSLSIVKSRTIELGDLDTIEDENYLPWKALPKSNTNMGELVPPIYRRHHKRTDTRQTFSTTFPKIP